MNKKIIKKCDNCKIKFDEYQKKYNYKGFCLCYRCKSLANGLRKCRVCNETIIDMNNKKYCGLPCSKYYNNLKLKIKKNKVVLTKEEKEDGKRFGFI